MSERVQPGRWRAQAAAAAAAAVWLACGCAGASAQAASGAGASAPAGANLSRARSDAAPSSVVAPAMPVMPEPGGTELDRVVAIVNGDLILDSDVDQDMRLEQLEPYGQDDVAPNDPRHLGTSDRARTAAITRLINRSLILQQLRLQPEDAIPAAEVDREISALRRNIPECAAYHCESDAGWSRFLAANGFTPESFRALWLQRMRVLAFIELRFRMGIKISAEQIAAYYEKTLLPQYRALGAQAPPLAVLSDRIQEVLLEQQVSNLLGDWLESLRAQGHVVVLHPGEVAP